MRLYVEFNINNFEAWSGAVDTKKGVGKCLHPTHTNGSRKGKENV